jgi:hypothetical protein
VADPIPGRRKNVLELFPGARGISMPVKF